MYIFHLCRDINFSYCSRCIDAAMLFGNISKRTCRTQIGDCIAWRMRQYIVCNAHQRILFSKHYAILTDKSQTVYIGIDDNAQIVVTLGNCGHYFTQIFLQRFGIMSKVTIGFSVDNGVFHSQLLQQLRKDNAANTVDGINAYLKMFFTYGIHIHQRQV